MTKQLTVINKSPAARVGFCNATIAFKGKIEHDFLELGRRLMMIRDEKLYADQWETFEDFIVDLKNISEATASKLINIYRVFVIEYKIPVKRLVSAGGWTMIAEIIPLIKNKADATQWLHKATELTRTDLRREITEAKTGVSMAECTHPHDQQVYLRVCLACGIKERVNELPKDIKLLGKNEALEHAINVIESYEQLIKERIEEGGKISKGFCGGTIFKNAVSDIRRLEAK